MMEKQFHKRRLTVFINIIKEARGTIPMTQTHLHLMKQRKEKITSE